MRHIKSYGNYKKYKVLQEKFDKNILILKDVELNSTDEKFFMDIFEKVLENVAHENV